MSVELSNDTVVGTVDDLDSNEVDSIFSDSPVEYIQDDSETTEYVSQDNDVEDEVTEDVLNVEEEQGANETPHKLWAGRFKSPEEMEEAFLSMSQKDDKTVFNELTKLRQQAMPINTNNSDGNTDQRVQELLKTNPQMALQVMTQQAVQQALKQYIAPMQTRVESLNMQTELNKLKSTKSDFGQVAPYLAKVFAENPELWNVKNPITTAYALAKAEYADKAVSIAKEEGRKEAYKSKARKTKAVAEGQKAKAQKKEKSEDEKLLDAIFNAGSKGGNVFF
jgi:hypothetical protein